jgi:4-hydroxy-3-methylbut-2-enyl diphosphate reductase
VGKLEVKIAPHSCYCYGVERAIRLAEQALREHRGREIFSLGPIIHNPIVVSKLEKQGLKVVEDISGIPEGAVVVIRSHGIPPDVLDELKKKNVVIIDATCPYVRRAQLAASQLKKEGYRVIIVGEKTHPEVIGIKGYVSEDADVVENVDEVRRIKPARKLGVVFQTTQSLSVIDEIGGAIIKKGFEIKIFNTICSATSDRQEAAREIAMESDVVIVVGGKNSGNTRRLYQIAREINKRTHHIESSEEIDAEWFKEARTVGITAGASTPRDIVEDVAEAVRQIGEESA